jgi:threonine aldolase
MADSVAATPAEQDTPSSGLRVIDLRSDTVTKPSPAMRHAMAEAEVGDDVYGEDPTVNRLERRAAEILGKEAGLFVPAGTMGNTVALKVHTRHGEEVICEAHSHIVDWELSMLAWFSGCLARTIPTPDGVLGWEAIRANIRKGGPHNAATSAISLENTHNMAGGTVYPLETLAEIREGALSSGLAVHMDGARIFNAATAAGCHAKEIAVYADTVMFCLSKGLGAPVGSMVVGSEEDVAQARLYRKRLGGGMRQAGILAAAGLIALEQMPARLADDHRNARFLADESRRIPGLRVTHEVMTNIVFIDISGTGQQPSELSVRLREHGVLMNASGERRMRMVTHKDVSRADCEQAIEALQRVVHGRAEAAARGVPQSPSQA